MVYGVCRAMLRNTHDAEDAAQQVFLSAHKALLGGARVRDHGGWLATIARNECRGRITAGMRSPLPVGDEELAAIPSPVDEQARHDQALEFREALAALPERQREAVVLRYLYGLRYGEVATALGLSRPATEALLFRARRALRGRLRPIVGTILVIPLSLREELALAIPGFSAGARAGTGAATVGVAGGMLAKLTAAPVGVKVATAAVAVSTVGAVGAIESDRPVRGQDAPPIVAISTGTTSEDQGTRSREQQSGSGGDEATGVASVDEERSGPSGRRDAPDEPEDDRSGPSSGSGSGQESVGGDSRSGSSSDSDAAMRHSDEDARVDADATTTDSSGPGSGGSDDDESSSGSSGTSGSGSSRSGRSGSGSSGSEDPPDDVEP